MILGSHNSWSYKQPKKCWQKLLSFTAKCQEKTAIEQYLYYNVRCFDLRIRFIDGLPHIVHNSFDYGKLEDIKEDLGWFNSCKDVVIRLIHDVRKEKDYTENNIKAFKDVAATLERTYSDIKFWCGRNLYNWEVDYDFPYKPECIELYSSVCPPKIIDDWCPYIYAKINNKSIKEKYTIDTDYNSILLIDYVNL